MDEERECLERRAAEHRRAFGEALQRLAGSAASAASAGTFGVVVDPRVDARRWIRGHPLVAVGAGLATGVATGVILRRSPKALRAAARGPWSAVGVRLARAVASSVFCAFREAALGARAKAGTCGSSASQNGAAPSSGRGVESDY
jgi:hypothetical protein